MDVHNVFLALPVSGDGQLSVGTHLAINQLAATKHKVYEPPQGSSALTMNFNALWCNALNVRESLKIDRFVMVHTDIVPHGNDWLDKLLTVMDETGADVVSAIAPIKDSRGLTSTALDTCSWTPRRLTLREVYDLPETFDGAFVKERYGANLLVNTGLMVVRFTEPWVEDVCFTIDNRIARVDGRFTAFFEPEDWKFSRWANARGLKLVATRRVQLGHAGGMMYDNASPWGDEAVDGLNLVSGARAAAGQIPG